MIRAALLAVLLLGTAGPAAADAGWFDQGDTVLRNDLVLLNDAAVIRLPVNQWPVPRASVRYAIENAKEHFATNQAVMAALDRVRGRLEATAPANAKGVDLEAWVTAGKAGLWRDFDTVGREDAELGGRVGYSMGERAEVSLRLAVVDDPADGQGFRADGSHATVQWGNWLLSANTLDRWWGPGHEGSLILSNNARPMPTLMVERASARPFESRWLNWLGPWTMNFALSRMESEREDIDAPLFMAWRVTIMPLKDIEIGFSRTAQFCGEQLECNWSVFWNMLIGNDNVGIDATAENEPGNQMAGFDLRWSSPIGNWPYAIYSQFIGEDESAYTPAKYISQYGIETWKPLTDGGLVQVFAEYSTTTCSASTSRGPYYNCAYNQGKFKVEGYRYLGRVLGYTADRDAENYALGANYTTAGGELWSATARSSRLNRDDFGDVRNTVAHDPTDYLALELGWGGKVFGQHFNVDFGLESLEPVHGGGERETQAYGFIRWDHTFAP